MVTGGITKPPQRIGCCSFTSLLAGTCEISDSARDNHATNFSHRFADKILEVVREYTLGSDNKGHGKHCSPLSYTQGDFDLPQ